MPSNNFINIDLPRALRCADYRKEISDKIGGFDLSDACEAAAKELEKRSNRKGGRKPKPVTIRGQVFDNVKAAAEHFGISVNTVKLARQRGRLDSVGFGSGYRDEETKKRTYEKMKKEIHFEGCVFNGWAEAKHITGRPRSYMLRHGAVVK